MAKLLNYEFTIDNLKRGAYSPQAHADFQNDQLLFRKAAIEVLTGVKPLKVQSYATPDLQKEIDSLRKGLIKIVEGEQPLKTQDFGLSEKDKI